MATSELCGFSFDKTVLILLNYGFCYDTDNALFCSVLSIEISIVTN